MGTYAAPHIESVFKILYRSIPIPDRFEDKECKHSQQKNGDFSFCYPFHSKYNCVLIYFKLYIMFLLILISPTTP